MRHLGALALCSGSSDHMRIKEKPQDFVVEEITPDMEVLEAGKQYPFSGGDGDQLICVLEKINWDTNRAMKFLARRLHVSTKRIGFAGTKDKRAWTTQRISIWGVRTEDVERISIKDMWVKPLSYSRDRISLGDLWGNRFTITIRDLTEKERELLERPKEFIVPNMFGIQRFGEKRPVTHIVGKALIMQNPEAAAKVYLAWIGPGEREETKEARRKLAENWNWKEALEYFPEHLGYERAILHHLADYPNDYANALRQLPRNLLKMFVHAYQSYLFNKYLSEREKSIGLDIVDRDIPQDSVPTGPLYGYETELASGVPGEIEKKVIKEENVDLEDFRVKPVPEVSSRGGRRPISVKVHQYTILEKDKDHVRIQFSLEKGAYATTVLDYIFRKQYELPDPEEEIEKMGLV